MAALAFVMGKSQPKKLDVGADGPVYCQKMKEVCNE